jgi:hypothetical protein
MTLSHNSTEAIMDYKLLDQILPVDATIVPLHCLIPDQDLYSVMFMQPLGEVMISDSFVGHSNAESAKIKFKVFLKLALSNNVDLVVTPEYSCPWSVIIDQIENNELPSPGQIWVLGCEGITPASLAKTAATHPNVSWIFDDNIIPAGGKTYLNPAIYVFQTKIGGDTFKTVIAVQFKGQPSSDHSHQFERDSMLLGKTIYILRNDNNSVYLTTLICSDCFGFNTDDLPPNIYQPYLILHLQLNLDPKNIVIRNFREQAYLYNREKQEFMCVNWAQGFKLPNYPASQYGGTGYFLKTPELAFADERINSNHAKGLYYCRSPQTRSHAYFFHYSDVIFYFRTTKASQLMVPGVVQARTGPEMLDVYEWNHEGTGLIGGIRPDDGFRILCGRVQRNIYPINSGRLSPINIERLLLLSNGDVDESDGIPWYHPTKLRSFRVEENEVLKRITFVENSQKLTRDPLTRDPYYYLLNFDKLKNDILSFPTKFPQNIDDLATDYEIRYPVADGLYNYNICHSDGSNPATVAFLGTVFGEFAEYVFDKMSVILGENKRRLVVWHEQNGVFHRRVLSKGQIDDYLAEDPRSISKESQQ